MVFGMINVDAVVKSPNIQILGPDAADLDIQEVVGIGRRGAEDFCAGSGNQNRVGIDIRRSSGGSHLLGVIEEQVGYSGADSLQGQKRAVGVGYEECRGDGG